MTKLSLARSICCFALLTDCQHHVAKEPNKANDQINSEFVYPEEEVNPYGSFFFAEREPDTFVENVGQVATFRFIGRRFTPDTKYIFASQNLGHPIKPIVLYEADDDGQLGRQVHNGTMMLDNESLLMLNYFRGEPVKYWLYTSNGKVRLSTTIVPYPIRVTARDGAQINIRRLTQDARLVICEGEDFLADEKILISSQSGAKRTSNVPIVCVNGKFSMIFEPGEDQRSGGIAYVDVQRFNERLMLDYHWGWEAVNPKKLLGNAAKIKPDALLKLPTDLDNK